MYIPSLYPPVNGLNGLVFIALMAASSAPAQNLVLNGSFEDTLCIGPLGALPVPYAGEHWYNPNYGTSDVYAMDPPIPGCGVGWMNDPTMTALGVWQAPFDGVGLAGLFCYHSFFCLREYLQVPLSEPLDGGKKYCISFRVALRGNSIYALDRLGVHLSQNPVLDWGGSCTMGVVAQVQAPENEVLTGAGNWILVSGDHIAQGGEAYLTVGNFVPDSDVNAYLVDSTATSQAAYYYIDDVMVELCDISTGLPHRGPGPVSWFDANSAILHVDAPEAGRLRLLDHSGRLVYAEQIRTGENLIHVDGLPNGQYLASLEYRTGREVVRIVVLR